MPKVMQTFMVVCPCGMSRYLAADSESEAIDRFKARGWSWVRKAKDGDLEGVCQECRDLMNEDE